MESSHDMLELFRRLLKQDLAGFIGAMADREKDVGELLRFAHRHHLAAFAYQMLDRLGVAPSLPHGALVRARVSALIERQMSQDLGALLPELTEMFNEHGVPVLCMKGPLFAQRFYGGIEARGYSDLDLLLRSPPDLDRVDALLLGRGFQRTFRILINQSVSRYFSHHFGYRRGKLPVEIHWALQRHFTFAFDYDRVWSTSVKTHFQGHTYTAASNEYELVLQIIGLLTDLQVGKLVFRSFVDIYQILVRTEATTNWEEFFAWRAREGILRPSVYLLSLTLELLDCHKEFPSLSAELQPKLDGLPSRSLAHDAVFHSEKSNLRQKVLALRLYEAPLLASLLWWLVSLPFRLAVYAGEWGGVGKRG